MGVGCLVYVSGYIKLFPSDFLGEVGDFVNRNSSQLKCLRLSYYETIAGLVYLAGGFIGISFDRLHVSFDCYTIFFVASRSICNACVGGRAFLLKSTLVVAFLRYCVVIRYTRRTNIHTLCLIPFL